MNQNLLLWIFSSITKLMKYSSCIVIQTIISIFSLHSLQCWNESLKYNSENISSITNYVKLKLCERPWKYTLMACHGQYYTLFCSLYMCVHKWFQMYVTKERREKSFFFANSLFHRKSLPCYTNAITIIHYALVSRMYMFHLRPLYFPIFVELC